MHAAAGLQRRPHSACVSANLVDTHSTRRPPASKKSRMRAAIWRPLPTPAPSPCRRGAKRVEQVARSPSQKDTTPAGRTQGTGIRAAPAPLGHDARGAPGKSRLARRLAAAAESAGWRTPLSLAARWRWHQNPQCPARWNGGRAAGRCAAGHANMPDETVTAPYAWQVTVFSSG